MSQGHCSSRNNAILVGQAPGGGKLPDSPAAADFSTSIVRKFLLLALHDRAARLGLAPMDLVIRRLAELRRRIVVALDEINVQQLHNTRPGHLLLLLPGCDLKLRVFFSPHKESEAIYDEVLMTPAELQCEKHRLAAAMKENPSPAAGVTGAEPTESFMIGWVSSTQDHWNGRKND